MSDKTTDTLAQRLAEAAKQFAALPQWQQDRLNKKMERLAEPMPRLSGGYSAW